MKNNIKLFRNSGFVQAAYVHLLSARSTTVVDNNVERFLALTHVSRRQTKREAGIEGVVAVL